MMIRKITFIGVVVISIVLTAHAQFDGKNPRFQTGGTLGCPAMITTVLNGTEVAFHTIWIRNL
jgi:hypothetical protein